jgi:hypothetical protein
LAATRAYAAHAEALHRVARAVEAHLPQLTPARERAFVLSARAHNAVCSANPLELVHDTASSIWTGSRALPANPPSAGRPRRRRNWESSDRRAQPSLWLNATPHPTLVAPPMHAQCMRAS